jgi:glycosyltransferase involved in cell wall biosynthesis
MQYIIISPVKDEARHIIFTLNSVINQQVLPNQWIIVDDGSSDNTLSILKDYESKYNWIKVIENNNKGEERAGGIKVVRAFYVGYYYIKCHDYDFIVKLDGDLQLPENYFQEVIGIFNSQPKVGICGGFLLNKIGDKLIQEGPVDYHVRGAFKSVRKQCFEDIGGFKHLWNWDGIDEMQAMYLGWQVKVLDLPVIHFRPTSAAYNPIRFNITDGIDAYKLRSNFILTIIRTIVRFKRKPYILCGVAYFCGFMKAFILHENRDINKPLAHFINNFHFKRILKRQFILK